MGENGAGTFFSFPGGWQDRHLGGYSCTSELEVTQHYIVNGTTLINIMASDYRHSESWV